MGLLTDLLGATGLNENKKDIYLSETGVEPKGTAQEAIQSQLETLDRAARGIPLEAGQKAAIDITDIIKKGARNGQTKVEYEQPSLDDILGSIFGEKTSKKVEQQRETGGLGEILTDMMGSNDRSETKKPNLKDILGNMYKGEEAKIEQNQSKTEDVFGDILSQIGKELTNKGAKTEVANKKMSIDISDIMDNFR